MIDKIQVENVKMITQIYNKEDIKNEQWVNIIALFNDQYTKMIAEECYTVLYAFMNSVFYEWLTKKMIDTPKVTTYYLDWIQRMISKGVIIIHNDIPLYTMIWIVK